MQDNSLLIEKIEEVISSLDRFKKFYDQPYEPHEYKIPVDHMNSVPSAPPTEAPTMPVAQPVTQPVTVVTNNYYSAARHVPYFIDLAQPSVRETIIINNCDHCKKDQCKCKKNEEVVEKKDEVGPVVKTAAVVGGVALAFAGTYIATKDEFVAYLMTSSSKKIKEMIALAKLNDNPLGAETIIISNDYNDWITEFGNRTRPVFVGKGGAVTSSIAGCVGLYCGMTAIAATGLVGATVCGCYLFWNYMMPDKEDEQKQYNKLLKKLHSLLEKTKMIPYYTTNNTTNNQTWQYPELHAVKQTWTNPDLIQL